MYMLVFKRALVTFLTVLFFYSSSAFSVKETFEINGKFIEVEKIETSKCPVCIEPYGQEIKFTLLKECNHAVCHNCVAGLENNGDYKCPLCTKVSKRAEECPWLTNDESREDLYKCNNTGCDGSFPENTIRSHLEKCYFSQDEQQKMVSQGVHSGVHTYLDKLKKEGEQLLNDSENTSTSTHVAMVVDEEETAELTSSVEVFNVNQGMFQFEASVVSMSNGKLLNNSFYSDYGGIKEYEVKSSNRLEYLESTALQSMNNVGSRFFSIVVPTSSVDEPKPLTLVLKFPDDYDDTFLKSDDALKYYLIYFVEVPTVDKKYTGIQQMTGKDDTYILECSDEFQLIDTVKLSGEDEKAVKRATGVSMRKTRLNSVKFTVLIAYGDPGANIEESKRALKEWKWEKENEKESNQVQVAGEGAHRSPLLGSSRQSLSTFGRQPLSRTHSDTANTDVVRPASSPNCVSTASLPNTAASDKPSTQVTMKLLSQTKVPTKNRHIPQPFPSKQSLFLLTEGETPIVTVYLDVLHAEGSGEIVKEIRGVQTAVKRDIEKQKVLML